MTTKADRVAAMRAAYGNRHPALLDALTFLDWEHLPSPLREVSQPFAALADQLVRTVTEDSAQLTMAVHRLIEAKDCAVRAALP